MKFTSNHLYVTYIINYKNLKIKITIQENITTQLKIIELIFFFGSSPIIIVMTNLILFNSVLL